MKFAIVLASALIAAPAMAEPVHVYGPGGPLPAMREAAAAFSKAQGIEVLVVGGPTSAWSERAKADGDLVYSGAETMMSDFLTSMPDTLDPASVEPLYLRASAILVRPGNPSGIKGVEDLFKPGHRILVVNGSGQGGLWEDIAGRLGSIESVKGFRMNIAKVARNSAEAKQAWTEDASLDAWLIWTIWQKSNPSLADIVDIEPQYRIYRDAGIALTKKGQANADAGKFKAYLSTPEAQAIFVKWGWTASTSR